VAANLTWLSWVLYADAIASPAGSALAFTAAAGRESFAMAKNRFLPRAAGKVNERSGVPRRALVINFVVAYLRGVRDGLRHLAAHPAPEPLATQEPPARPER
jgi:amino acid transporter